jgi:tetratricopeptide (TPR) repeat protein
LNKKLDLFKQMSDNYDSMKIACENKEIKSGLKRDCKSFQGVVDSIRTLYWRETYNSGVQVIDTVNEIVKNIKNATDSTEIANLKEQLKMTADSGNLYFRIATIVDSSKYRAFEGIGLLYDRLKQHDSSLVWFLKASEMVPDSIYLIQNIAYSYIQTDNWDNAIAYFKKYLAKVPGDASTCFNIAIWMPVSISWCAPRRLLIPPKMPAIQLKPNNFPNSVRLISIPRPIT